MKNLFRLIALTALIAVVMESCSPTITPISPVTLVLLKTRFPTQNSGGILTKMADTNLYDYALSCGCAFPLKAEGADTSSLFYDLSNLKDTITDHKIKASPRSGLTFKSGQKYIGWLAITTIQPITTELLKDTLRDTVLVP